MIQLNNDQQKVFEDAVKWWDDMPYQTFEISGPPGSGKTFLINYIIDFLGIDRDRIAPMAYTGAAAINMRQKGMINARTCYSWLYDCVETVVLDDKGKVVMDPIFNRPKTKISFVEKPRLDGIDLIIVDEAGAVPPDMRKVIDKKGIPVIAAGDLDQLPPITGRPGYLNERNKVHVINQIMRQNEGNSIIQLSQRAKNRQPIYNGFYGNVIVIDERELTDDILKWADVILCAKNNTRDYYTKRIRQDILGHYTTLPEYGERVVCRKNNWKIESNGINLTNGLLGNVVDWPNPNSIDRKNNTFKMSFMPDLGTMPFNDLECDYKYLISPPDVRNQLKYNPYSQGNKFEFGYCITTHMAQGSEFSKGVYIEEYMNPSINNKLNYVGLTRFKDMCYYVKRSS